MMNVMRVLHGGLFFFKPGCIEDRIVCRLLNR